MTYVTTDWCNLYFVHPINLSFGFWYFGHFSCVIFFLFFFRLAHLALQNVNKDYATFCIFLTLSPKVTKNQRRTKYISFTENSTCWIACLLSVQYIFQRIKVWWDNLTRITLKYSYKYLVFLRYKVFLDPITPYRDTS